MSVCVGFGQTACHSPEGFLLLLDSLPTQRSVHLPVHRAEVADLLLIVVVVGDAMTDVSAPAIVMIVLSSLEKARICY